MIAAFLSLTAAMAFLAWLAIWARRPSASRYAAVITLPAAMVITWFALQQPLGNPQDGIAPGEYTVLGARIDTPTNSSAGAIYVLLDGREPVYVRLPYSNEAAEKLQAAMDTDEGAVIGAQEGGTFEFYAAPVVPEPPKQPERPAFRIGG